MSTPFSLGLPVLDTPAGTKFVLRGRNEDDCCEKINAFRKTVPTTDLIKICDLGLRPDKPVPVSAYFMEVQVCENESYHDHYMQLFHNFWNFVLQGQKEE